MNLRSYPIAKFWEHDDTLPIEIQRQADKQYSLFALNPYHPSLQFKQIGPYWSVRVSIAYRALARRRGDNLYWFSIGPHDEYERLIMR